MVTIMALRAGATAVASQSRWIDSAGSECGEMRATLHVPVAQRLRSLIDYCNGLEGEISLADRSIARARYEQGRALIEIRSLLGHGVWLAWLERFSRTTGLWMAPSTARLCIRFAEAIGPNGDATQWSIGYTELCRRLKLRPEPKKKKKKEQESKPADPPTHLETREAEAVSKEVGYLPSQLPHSKRQQTVRWRIVGRRSNLPLGDWQLHCPQQAAKELLYLCRAMTAPFTIEVIPADCYRCSNLDALCAECSYPGKRVPDAKEAKPAQAVVVDALDGFEVIEQKPESEQQAAAPALPTANDAKCFSVAEMAAAVAAMCQLRGCNKKDARRLLDAALRLPTPPTTIDSLISAANRLAGEVSVVHVPAPATTSVSMGRPLLPNHRWAALPVRTG